MPLPGLKTSKQIRDQIITDIESQIGQNTPILYKAFNRVLASALALNSTILYKLGQWAYKQIFTITQGAEALEIKREQYGIPAKYAQAAQLSVNATGATGQIIPAGQTYRGDLNGLVYTVDTSVELAGGAGVLALTCLTPGENGNLITDDTLTILQPISGVDNAVTVVSITVEGEDAETVEELRARVSIREKLPPQGGSLLDYINWSLEVEGITRAFVFGKREEPAITAGHVNVYPITDGEASRIPTPSKLALVEAYIDSPGRAPTQAVAIEVLAMTEITVDVEITNLLPNTSDVKTALEANIADFLLAREPQQFADQTNIKNVMSRSLLEGVCTDSGATSLTLVMKIAAAPTETYTLAYDELAIVGAITYP